MGRPLIDLTGQRFGRLLVTQHLGREHHASLWECLCDCGQAAQVQASALKSGATSSCGCYRVERMGALRRTHGARHTPEWKAWESMRRRCENSADKDWRRYGGRGIRVCERWRIFENFAADMGPRPVGHSIDRKDSDGNYDPTNCRWATGTQQARNRSSNRLVEWAGSRMTLIEAAEAAGIPYKSVKSRLQKGWSVNDALTRPLDESRRSSR